MGTSFSGGAPTPCKRLRLAFPRAAACLSCHALICFSHNAPHSLLSLWVPGSLPPLVSLEACTLRAALLPALAPSLASLSLVALPALSDAALAGLAGLTRLTALVVFAPTNPHGAQGARGRWGGKRAGGR